VRTFEYNFPILAVGDVPARAMQDNWAFEAAAPAQMIEIDKRWAATSSRRATKITNPVQPHKDGP